MSSPARTVGKKPCSPRGQCSRNRKAAITVGRLEFDFKLPSGSSVVICKNCHHSLSRAPRQHPLARDVKKFITAMDAHTRHVSPAEGGGERAFPGERCTVSRNAPRPAPPGVLRIEERDGGGRGLPR